MPIDPFIGQIVASAGSRSTLTGFVPCDGRLLSIQQNQALFSLLGTSFGGNGTTTFAVPDLRGRIPVGTNTAGRGQSGGQEAVNLTVATTPSHTHAFNGFSTPATTSGTANASFATVSPTPPPAPQPPSLPTPYGTPTNLVQLNSTMLATSGGSMPHENMQPFQVIKYFIATTGIYPSRP